MKGSIAAAALFAATVSAHGNITSPLARVPGPAMVKACGQTAVNAVLQDGTTPLEDVLQPLATCKLDLCRGAVFDDNKNRVQTFTPGQVIPMKAQLPIPHEGPANVSIVNTATNKIIGSMLLVFDSYADENLKTLPPNNTDFSVTMPANLGTQCAVAGECVLQWFWFGTAAKQTYESCVDFVMASTTSSTVGKAGGNTGSNSTTTVGSGSKGSNNSTTTVGSGSKGGNNSTTTTGGASKGNSTSSAGTATNPTVAGSAALPGTGEGNFGGVEGSIATVDVGKAASVKIVAAREIVDELPVKRSSRKFRML